MAFDFSYMDKKSMHPIEQEKPLVKIVNNKNNARKNSYLFLNAAAVKLLNAKQTDDYVKIGIDTESKKIVIVPTTASNGRKLSIGDSGSATISVKALIEDNDLPNITKDAGFHSGYALGGIIFNYKED